MDKLKEFIGVVLKLVRNAIIVSIIAIIITYIVSRYFELSFDAILVYTGTILIIIGILPLTGRRGLGRGHSYEYYN